MSRRNDTPKIVIFGILICLALAGVLAAADRIMAAMGR